MQRNRRSLDHAVTALRGMDAPETLSSAARTAILHRVSEPGEVRGPLAALFPTSWRLALAGALPLALALTVVLLAGRGGTGTTQAPEDPVARKVGGSVVFEVAAGSTVTKSPVPFAFDDRHAVRVANGRYADQVGSGPNLVFYRIE
jgi:hypothetical protein